MAIGWEIIDDFEGDVATKNDNRIEWYDGTKDTSNSGDMGSVLTNRAIKLMFVFAISGNLGPVDAVTMTINPAEVTFGFKNENSPLVDGKTVNLQKFGVGNDVIFDMTSIGFGVGLGKVTIH